MTPPVKVQVKRLPHGEGLPPPAYATSGAAGMDVVSAEDVTLAPGARPRGAPRRARGVPHPDASPGRPPLKVILINLGTEPFAIARGDRVAQLVLAPVVQAAWDEVAELDATERGAGGFGSTGGHAKL